MIKVIELTADVTNPHPDRRSKDWNKLPVLTKGRRFTVHDGRDFNYLYASDERYHHEPVHSDLGKAIVANAIDVEPNTITEMLRVNDIDYSGDFILEKLVRLGRVTPDDFKAVADAMAADENF